MPQSDWARLAPTSGALGQTGAAPRPSEPGTKPVKRPDAKPSADSDLWGFHVVAEPAVDKLWYSQAELPGGTKSDELCVPSGLDMGTLWVSEDIVSEVLSGVGGQELIAWAPPRSRPSFAERRMATLRFVKANPGADEVDIADELGISLKLAARVYDSLLLDGFLERI